MMDSLWIAACPSCRKVLGPMTSLQNQFLCMDCGTKYVFRNGIWHFLAAAREPLYGKFLRDYKIVRRAEGRGSEDSKYYLDLPFVPKSDPLAWQWLIRSRTYQIFAEKILSVLGKRLRIMDLGAGTAWLSHQLAKAGHLPCAVDINLDPLDGLCAARHFTPSWPLVWAEFDFLPFADLQADLVVYNASFHYSVDYRQTLNEALRVLRPQGKIVILDTPLYRRHESGLKMVEERRQEFRRKYGTSSDSLASIDFLTRDMLDDLEKDLGLKFNILRVWYGFKWALRPAVAALKRKREPSTFAVIVGERASKTLH